ncbi:MAG: hypothetical protein HUU21_12950 [Polyangiaceae bacterium]|nr:hypothetical protein [Polyangiaceae bacterium]
MVRVENAFELRLDAPATPQRVAAAAQFVERVLDITYPNLPEGSVTLVVTNYNMGTGVRANTQSGRVAIRMFMDFLANPTKALAKNPVASGIAAVLAAPGEEIQSAKIVKLRGKLKVLATLDEQFSRQMRALANVSRPEPALRGSTIIYSPVLRVGRLNEDTTIRARVRIDGAWRDIPIKDNRESFYDAAKDGRLFPIKIETVWLRGPDGKLFVDVGRTKLVSVDHAWSAVPGAEFVRLVHEAAPSGFDEEELAERVARIRERQ